MLYKELSEASKKKLLAQQKLAKNIIVSVPALEGRRFDQWFLSKALAGRTDVTKTVGRSYVSIKGVTVPMRPFRDWLDLFSQDPKTGERINWNQRKEDSWVYVARETDSRKDNLGNRILVLHFVSEGLDVKTTFKDQVIQPDWDANFYTDHPVIHKVTLENE